MLASSVRQRPSRRRPLVATLVACLALGIVPLSGQTPASAAPAASDLREPQQSEDGVEVSTYGTDSVAVDMRGHETRVYQAVHAVQRLDNVTVVYWSIGWDVEPWLCCSLFGPYGRGPIGQNTFAVSISPAFVNVVFPTDGRLLYAIPDPTRDFGTPPTAASTADALPDEPGVMNVVYSVLPPLPAGVDTVDVTLGYAGLVLDVPVDDGLLEPTVEGPQIPVGTGWPEIPPQMLEPLPYPEVSERPLFAPTERIDGFSRERAADADVTIDVAADLLFAFNSADLSPDASAQLAALVDQIAERATAGEIAVIGHTDDVGDDAFNSDLSVRRAAAVAGVLEPALATAGLDVSIEGRGEREPVVENDTEQNRQLNRRVSIVFTAAAS